MQLVHRACNFTKVGAEDENSEVSQCHERLRGSSPRQNAVQAEFGGARFPGVWAAPPPDGSVLRGMRRKCLDRVESQRPCSRLLCPAPPTLP